MQNIIDEIVSSVEKYLTFPTFTATDFVEIIILTFLIYELMSWIKNTRAWMLFKGIALLIFFVLLATIFKLNTILWVADKTFGVGVTAAIIVFQPELRKALEQLGRRKMFENILQEQRGVKERFSDRTVNELIKATFELAKHKTGALIVIENEINLGEYVRTGIEIDAEISNQLLINIFEHNTPLHDGAVIIKENRIVAATCYLPLSDSMEISKELGTRHRAGLGVSENTDSLTIIVSEETGKVSYAIGGVLKRSVDGEMLREELVKLQNKVSETRRFKIWKGRKHNEKGINE